MIDTDKVKGVYCSKQQMIVYLNAVEEVKRLQKQFKLAYDWVDNQFPDGGVQDFAKYIGDVIE